MPVHTWRRHHGQAIVAQIEPLEGIGTWQACAWLTSDPTVVVRSPRQAMGFITAQAAADHLARSTFDHTCAIHTCDDWTFWPHEG
jgi:hypothetical protein